MAESTAKKGELNLLERAIAVVAPGAALSRARSRAALTEFGYDSVNSTRSRGPSGGLWKNAAAESPRMNTDRVKLMWEARDLERQFGFMKGMLSRTVDYTCHRIAFKARTGDDAVNKEYEDYFHDWCGRSDYTGRHRFVTQVRLALRSMLRDGDFGFVKHDVGGELRLQGIEGDRIGNPQDAGQSDEGKIGGITLGEDGEVTNYEIFKRGRTTSSYTKSADVAPGQFIHLYNPTRMDQYRGITWFDTSMGSMRDLYECMRFEMSAAKYASSFAGFIYQESNLNLGGAGAWDGAGDGKQPASMKAREGTIVRLENGERYQPAPSTVRPSGAFLTLIEVYLREIAAGLNLPFGFVYDMARFGGVTARLETQQAQRVFQQLQELLEQRLLNDVKNSVLMRGIAQRKIRPHPNWKTGGWLFGAWLTADIGHETNADIALLEAGLTSETRLVQKYGGDADEIAMENGTDVQRRVRVTQVTGTPIELQHQRQPQATSLLAAANVAKDGEGEDAPEPEPVQPTGLVAEQGEKAAKPLIEILKSVSLGKMDRESGIAAIMRLYDLSRLEAEQMVPVSAGARSGGVME